MSNRNNKKGNRCLTSSAFLRSFQKNNANNLKNNNNNLSNALNVRSNSLNRNDLSNRAVVIMLSLVILVSVLSLALYIYVLSTFEQGGISSEVPPTGAAIESAGLQGSGKVTIQIMNPPEEEGGKE